MNGTTGQPGALALTLFVTAPVASGDDAGQERRRLDAACEAAREDRLAQKRERLVEVCVKRFQYRRREGG